MGTITNRELYLDGLVAKEILRSKEIVESVDEKKEGDRIWFRSAYRINLSSMSLD
jgi:hypothetical protein